jgi:hypothetical protein
MSDANVPSPLRPGSGGYEKRDVNVLKVILYGVSAIVVVVALVIFMLDYFTATREELVYESVLKPESTALRELRAREEEELNSYAVLDAGKGIYRIPVERAMELMAEQAYQQKREEIQGRNQ